MSQLPRPPLWQRALRLSAAQLGLLQLIDPISGPLAASEQAALQLRRAAQGSDAQAARSVSFLIPLVGAHIVQDWEGVVGRLRHSLARLIAQSDPNWRAFICCQDRPDLPNDPRISFVPFEETHQRNDKWAKLAHLVRYWAARADGSGYVMGFDADDLPHPELVAEMLRGQAAGGYLIARGYIRDVSTGQVACSSPPSLAEPFEKPFWKLCGSCAALRYDLGQSPAEFTTLLEHMVQHEHRMFPYLAKLAGLALMALPEPRVLYELNHGDNFGARRGRVRFKSRFVERFAISGPDELQEIERSFPSYVSASAAQT